jgi:hypothetical protein
MLGYEARDEVIDLVLSTGDRHGLIFSEEKANVNMKVEAASDPGWCAGHKESERRAAGRSLISAAKRRANLASGG